MTPHEAARAMREAAADCADEWRSTGHDDDCPCALCGVARGIRKAIRALPLPVAEATPAEEVVPILNFTLGGPDLKVPKHVNASPTEAEAERAVIEAGRHLRDVLQRRTYGRIPSVDKALQKWDEAIVVLRAAAPEGRQG